MITLAIISYCVLSVSLVQCADNNADNNDRSATVLKTDFNNDGLGPYNFLFETSNGIKQSEQSSAIATKNAEELLIEVVGSYSYPGTDGKIYEVKYVANATGFYPTGDHIKVPPVVPWPSSNTLDDNANSGLTGSDSDNTGVITSNDQGQVSIDSSGNNSVSSVEVTNEFGIQNLDISGVQINASSTGNQITSSVADVVQNTYIPPPQTTYLPPQTTYLPPHTTYLPPHYNDNKLSSASNPKNINQLLLSGIRPENQSGNINNLFINSNHISENQKREAKYEMINPDSKMNQFANPSNIVYFILKPQGFSMPS